MQRARQHGAHRDGPAHHVERGLVVQEVVGVVAQVAHAGALQQRPLARQFGIGHGLAGAPVARLQFEHGAVEAARRVGRAARQALEPRVAIGFLLHARHGHQPDVVVGRERGLVVLREPLLGLRLEHRARIEVARGFQRGPPGAHARRQLVREVDQVARLGGGPARRQRGVGADRGHVGRQAPLRVSGQCGGARVLVVGQRRVVVEQHALEEGVAAQVFVDVTDQRAHRGVEGREAVVAVGRRLAALRHHRVRGERVRCRQAEGRDRHPRVDLHAGARAQLPCGAAEQVGAHRQVAVGKVHRVGHAVAVGIGIGLQEHRARAHGGHAVDQRRQVALLLGRVGVVHVVEVDVHHAVDRAHLAAHRAAQQLRVVGRLVVVGGQRAADARERHGTRVGAVVEREGDGHARALRGFQRGRVVGAVGPHGGAHLGAGARFDDLAAAAQVGLDAAHVGGVVFVAAGLCVVAVRGRRRQHVALRVGEHAGVHRVGVARELDQARARHLGDFGPQQEVLARRGLVAPVNQLAFGHVEPARHQREQRGIVVALEQREHLGVGAAVAVVEGQQHGLRGQRLAAGARIDDLLQAHRVVAVVLQPGEHVGQRAVVDGGFVGRVLEAGAHAGAHVVEGQHAKRHAVVGIGRRQRLCEGGMRQQQRKRQRRQQPQQGRAQEGRGGVGCRCRRSHHCRGIERFRKTPRCRSRAPS